MSEKKEKKEYPNKPKKSLDSGYYHEALDRTYLATNFIDDVLAQHPVYEKHKLLKKKINKIVDELATLYQIIGGLEHIKLEQEEATDSQTLKK